MAAVVTVLFARGGVAAVFVLLVNLAAAVEADGFAAGVAVLLATPKCKRWSMRVFTLMCEV